MSSTITADLGHDVRRQVWAEIGADEVYEQQYRQQIANASSPADASRAEFQLAAVEKHEHGLWDALANAQSL